MPSGVERNHFAHSKSGLTQGGDQFAAAKDVQKHVGNLPVVEEFVPRIEVAHECSPQIVFHEPPWPPRIVQVVPEVVYVQDKQAAGLKNAAHMTERPLPIF